MYGMPPDGGRALFGSMRPLLSKPDLMIANLEGTYSTAGPSQVQRRLGDELLRLPGPAVLCRIAGLVGHRPGQHRQQPQHGLPFARLPADTGGA